MDKLFVKIYHEGRQVATFRKLGDFYQAFGGRSKVDVIGFRDTLIQAKWR